MKRLLSKKMSLKTITRSACTLITFSLFSVGSFADNRSITEGGSSDMCHAREIALDLAHTDAFNNAHETCAALGDNWKYDKELFAGYEQCTPCGSSKEYKCKVTQAKFVCRTRKN
ncbi:hypothetical protein [Pseudomonas sp. JAI120]|uniref:hypothetical protein n=1 Tax=Pseudomonas sp. JAI120 TaxID=2723063 RepID=UPI0030D82EAF